MNEFSLSLRPPVEPGKSTPRILFTKRILKLFKIAAVVSIFLSHSDMKVTLPMNLLSLFEYADYETIMKASTALIIVLDPLIPLNHETTVDMTNAVVNAMMAPKLSLGLLSHALLMWLMTANHAIPSELITSLLLKKSRNWASGFADLPRLQTPTFLLLSRTFATTLTKSFRAGPQRGITPLDPVLWTVRLFKQASWLENLKLMLLSVRCRL